MTCAEVQALFADGFAYARLPPPMQEHLEECEECQGEYPTHPVVEELLQEFFDDLPELELSPALGDSIWSQLEEAPREVREVRGEKEPKIAWLRRPPLGARSLALAASLLLAAVGSSFLWRQPASAPVAVAAAVEESSARAARLEVAARFANPLSGSDALFVKDSFASLHRLDTPVIESGRIVHVIQPLGTGRIVHRAVVRL